MLFITIKRAKKEHSKKTMLRHNDMPITSKQDITTAFIGWYAV